MRATAAATAGAVVALARTTGVMLAALLAGACTTMHADKSSQPQPPAPPATVQASGNNTPGTVGSTTEAATQDAATADNAKTSSVAAPAGAPAPPCSCIAKAKPKPRPKPPVAKEAPPQLPTAPAVVATPPGGVVDAQVRSMNVSVTSILGRRVRGAAGEDMGRVVDVLADSTGRVRAAIIDFGGFLGVGNHRIAVDWPLLRFNAEAVDEPVQLSVSREKLQTAPEYKPVPRPQSLTEPPAPAAPPTTPAAEGKT